jgi:phosphatidate cytidylyltransferase
MTRILSALVLIPIVVGTVWYLPPVATLGLAEIAALVAFLEYAELAARLHAAVPRVLVGTAVTGCCAAIGLGSAPVDGILMAALIAVAATSVAFGRPDPSMLSSVGAAVLAPVYLGLPLGSIAAVRVLDGRAAVLALLLTLTLSDSAQYYGGRALGRHLLAPSISPKKTVEGAVAGLVAATIGLAAAGPFLLPAIAIWRLALLGAALAALGIVGDLFESLLKRSADVKDSSGLIPGHGGLLDRIDSWLFAAPAYYVFLRYAG